MSTPSATPTEAGLPRPARSAGKGDVPKGTSPKPFGQPSEISVPTVDSHSVTSVRPSVRPHVPTAVRTAVYTRDAWRCWLCGGETSRASRGHGDPIAPTLDHLTPYSAGGSDDEANLATAHRACNVLRGADRGPAPGSPAYGWALELAAAEWRDEPATECRARGCAELPRVAGRCGRHYASWAERRWASNPHRPACGAGSCSFRAAYGHGGYCRRHARLVRELGTAERGCAVDGCELGHDTAGLCSRHRSRWRRYGTPTPSSCSVDGCATWRHATRELCDRHGRWRALYGRVPAECATGTCRRPVLVDGAELCDRCGKSASRRARRPRRERLLVCYVDGCTVSRAGRRLYCPDHWHTVERCQLETCGYPHAPGSPLCGRHLYAAQRLAIAAA